MRIVISRGNIRVTDVSKALLSWAGSQIIFPRNSSCRSVSSNGALNRSRLYRRKKRHGKEGLPAGSKGVNRITVKRGHCGHSSRDQALREIACAGIEAIPK